MAAITGDFLQATTGPVILTGLPFQPSSIEFNIGSRYGTTENSNARWGFGSASAANNQRAIATLVNTNGYYTRNYGEYCIVALGTPGASIARILSAEFVGFTSDGFELDFDVCTENFKIHFTAIE